MAPVTSTPVSVTLTVSPETATMLLAAARQQRDALARVRDEAKVALANAEKALADAEKQVLDIETIVNPRTLVGTREYASESRYGVKHTVTKYSKAFGKSTLHEYECSCEAFRFSKASPKACKHTRRAIYDWFVQPRFGGRLS